MARTGELKDMTNDEVVAFGTTEIVEQVLGGKKSLLSAMHWIVDVSSRWGYERKIKSDRVVAAMKRANAVLGLAHRKNIAHTALENLMKELRS